MSEIDVFIAGRAYKVACRDGEEDALRKAAALVDTKSREALAGLGTLSEARQLLFASLLLADEMVDGERPRQLLLRRLIRLWPNVPSESQIGSNCWRRLLRQRLRAPK